MRDRKIITAKSLKSKKKADTDCFIMSVKKYGWAIQKNVFHRPI